MEDIRDVGVPLGLVGHVGDGNFHLAFMIDPECPEELDRVSHFNGRLVRRALAMEGTCTGEHGVGLGKMGFLREEHGDAVDVMGSIKAALDPRGMLNPGKVVELG
jgi:D-lactate dehydrogenase (cytochrome)